MSDDQNWGFAAPPFKADDALARLKRDLREPYWQGHARRVS